MDKIDYNEKFYTDLDKGEAGEDVIAKYFNNRGWRTKSNPNKNSDYDIILLKNNKIIRLEVKTDEYYKKLRTNNMVFEVSCNGKPSGLNSSKAHYYVYYFPEEKMAYIASISKIKSIIGQCITVMGGDKKASKLYLVDRTIWGEHFKIINIETN